MIEKTRLQQLIIEIWSELLDLDSVGPDDDFLSLGGNSVQAMQFISRFREACGFDVSQEMLFTDGSPSNIASALTDST
jgi:aryl carrier-like protein